MLCGRVPLSDMLIAVDVLTDLLAAAAVRGVVGAHIEAGADWGWWSAQSHGAAFHAVTSGTMWLHVEGDAPRELLAGDVVLLPRGTPHVLGSDPAALRRTGPDRFDAADLGDYDGGGGGVVRIGRPPERTHVLCAHYLHDASVATPVLPALPDVVHVRAEDGGAGLADTVALLGRELAEPRLATSMVLDHLVDILLVQLLRAWVAIAPSGGLPGSLGALRDPVVGAALARLHDAPAEPWTAESLARAVAVSRATLARRFAAAVGEAPMAYLTRWRMDVAARRLRDTDDPLATVAAAVGYTSVYAFNRAFARARGVPPGRYRTASRAPAAAIAA